MVVKNVISILCSLDFYKHIDLGFSPRGDDVKSTDGS